MVSSSEDEPPLTPRNRLARVVLSSFGAYNNGCVLSEKNNLLSNLKQSSELSSSEDEGSGDRQPLKNGTEEEDSEEEEEEEEAKRVKSCKKKGLHPHPGIVCWELQFNKAGISLIHPVISMTIAFHDDDMIPDNNRGKEKWREVKSN